MKAARQVNPAIDPDIVRMAFVSLTMMPMLLKDIFQKQLSGIKTETINRVSQA